MSELNRDILRENRVHGDSIFPVGVYEIREAYNNDDFMSCHWHDEMEFLLVTEGKANFQIGTKIYEVSSGEGIFVNSGEIHAGYLIENCHCCFFAIVFNSDVLCNDNIYDPIKTKFIDPIIKRQYSIPSHISERQQWEKVVISYLYKIMDISSDKAFTYELLVKANLYNIFSIILSNVDLTTQSEEYSVDSYKIERLKKILEYIQENYSKKISIKELSSELNMSEGHFCRFFKKMVRKTPIDYINYYRVNRATTLLHSDKKIIEIAIDVGFENVSYFISTFKHYMRCTPNEYRKLNKV